MAVRPTTLSHVDVAQLKISKLKNCKLKIAQTIEFDALPSINARSLVENFNKLKSLISN